MVRRGGFVRNGDSVAERFGGTTLLAGNAPEKLSYQVAFQRHLGLNPHQADVATMNRAGVERGFIPPASLDPRDRDQWLNFLLATCIEPQLGFERPTIIYDYPASQAALARVRPGDPPCAERFELYVRGVELANGYHELLDPAVLRQRNQITNQQRAAEGKYALPEESRLLAAMEHGLPSCTGVAMGFDRIVMLAVGAKQIADVIAFPIDRAFFNLSSPQFLVLWHGLPTEPLSLTVGLHSSQDRRTFGRSPAGVGRPSHSITNHIATFLKHSTSDGNGHVSTRHSASAKREFLRIATFEHSLRWHPPIG